MKSIRYKTPMTHFQLNYSTTYWDHHDKLFNYNYRLYSIDRVFNKEDNELRIIEIRQNTITSIRWYGSNG